MIGILCAMGTYYLLKALINNSQKLGLLDVPNSRSSHCTPTPRGGGVVFFFIFMIGIAALYFCKLIDRHWVLPLLLGCPIVTIVGFMDDKRSLPAGFRLVVHLFAAFAVVIGITDGFEIGLVTDFIPIKSQIFLVPLVILFISWMINLYNFMDGIDGLAGIEGFTVCLVIAILSFWRGYYEVFAINLVLSLTLVSFLKLNWAPAKIFMGDSGAYFLGAYFAIMAIRSDQSHSLSVATHIILLGAFIVDATFTLVTRIVKREKIFRPHKKHAFQKAVESGWSHSKVSLFYGIVNLFYLAPLGLCSLMYPRLSWVFIIIALTPLFFLEYYFKLIQPKVVAEQKQYAEEGS